MFHAWGQNLLGFFLFPMVHYRHCNREITFSEELDAWIRKTVSGINSWQVHSEWNLQDVYVSPEALVGESSVQSGVISHRTKILFSAN